MTFEARVTAILLLGPAVALGEYPSSPDPSVFKHQQAPTVSFQFPANPASEPGLYVSRWVGAFRPPTLSSQNAVLRGTPPIPAGSGEVPFPGNQDGYFGFVVNHPSANTDPTSVQVITVNMSVRCPHTTNVFVLDTITGIQCPETGVNSPNFSPTQGMPMDPGYILVSNDVDDTETPGTPDGTPMDHTIKGHPGDVLRISIGNTNVDTVIAQFASVQVRYHILRMSEPYNDFGYVPAGGGQVIGRGDGLFSWAESVEANGVQDADEIGEPLPPGRDWNNDGIRTFGAPLATRTDAKLDLELLQAGWGQAGINPMVNLVANYDDNNNAWWLNNAYVRFVEPPGGEYFSDYNASGLFDFVDGNANMIHEPGEASIEAFWDRNGNDLYDRAVDLGEPYPTRGVDINNLPVTDEERNITDSIGDRNPDTIDIFVINEFEYPYETARAEALPLSFVGSPIRGNCIFIRNSFFGGDPGNPRDFNTSSHEFGHIIMNLIGHFDDGYTQSPDFTNLMNSGAVWGYITQDRINKDKRLTEAQAVDARTDPTTANLRK